MLLAVVVGGMLVCSLLATSLGTAWLSPSPDVESPPEADDAYERALREAITADPNDAVALVSLGNLLSTRGDYAAAIDLYEQAISLEPDNVDYRLDFALALTQAGNREDAELQFRRVLETDPDDADAHYFLGELYAGWQPPRREDAVASFERAIASAPGSVSASQAQLALARLRSPATPMPIS